MTDLSVLIQAYKDCRWMNDDGEIKDGAYAAHFDQLATVIEFTPRPLSRSEILDLMRIPYTGDTY